MTGVPIKLRWAMLGGQKLQLTGKKPEFGDRLEARFAIPAARGARRPLSSTQLRKGLVLVSTLPNIGKNACIAQIVSLEELAHRTLPEARLFHVSADEPRYWREVDQYHGDMTAPGYSLHGATEASRGAFVDAFGVGVQDHRRIAHGLFALEDGFFLKAEIPHDQMRTPDVARFLRALM